MTAEATLSGHAIRGGSWQAIGAVLKGLSQYVAVIIMARYVPPSAYGVAALAFVIIEFSAIFSRGGMGQALVQRTTVTDLHIRTAFTASTILSIICYLLLLAGSDWISAFFNEPRLDDVLVIAGLVFVMRGLGASVEAMMQRDLRFKTLMHINVVSQVFGYLIIGVGSAMMGASYWSYIYATLAFTELNLILMLFFSPHRMAPKIDMKCLMELGRFSVGLTLSQFFNFWGNYGDKVVGGRTLATASLGVYELAFRLVVMPAKALGDLLDKVTYPLISRVKEKREQSISAFDLTLTFCLFLILPVSVFLCVLADQVISVMLGEEWLGVVAPMKILLVLMCMRMIIRVCDVTVRASGAVFRSAQRKLYYAAMTIVLALIGSRWGINGIAIGADIATAITALLMLNLVYKLHNRQFAWNDLYVLQPGVVLSVIVVTCALMTEWAFPWSDNDLATLLFAALTSGIVTACMLLLRPEIAGEKCVRITRMVRSEVATRFR